MLQPDKTKGKKEEEVSRPVAVKHEAHFGFNKGEEMGVEGLTQKEAMLLLRALPSLQPAGDASAVSPRSPVAPPAPSASVSASNDGTSAAAKAKSPRLAKSHTERADRPAVGSKSGGPPPGTGAGTKLNLRKLNEDLVAENADLQKKLSHMKSKTESLAKLQSRFSDSEKKRKRADEENANLKAELAKLKAENEKLVQKAEYLESEKQGLEAEIGLLGQLAHAQTSNVRATVQMDQVYMKLRMEVEAYKDRAENEIKNKRMKEAEAAKLANELADLHSQMESQTEELDQVNLKYRRAKEDIRQYRNRIEKMRKESATATEKEDKDIASAEHGADNTKSPTKKPKTDKADKGDKADKPTKAAAKSSAKKPAGAKPEKTDAAPITAAAPAVPTIAIPAPVAPAAGPGSPRKESAPVSPRKESALGQRPAGPSGPAPPPPPAPPKAPAAPTAPAAEGPRSILFDQIKNTNSITLRKADERLQKLAEKPVDVNDESALKIIASALISRRNAISDQHDDDDGWDSD